MEEIGEGKSMRIPFSFHRLVYKVANRLSRRKKKDESTLDSLVNIFWRKFLKRFDSFGFAIFVTHSDFGFIP